MGSKSKSWLRQIATFDGRASALLVALAACHPTSPVPAIAPRPAPAEVGAEPTPVVVERRDDCGGLCPGWSQLAFAWHESLIGDVAISEDGETIATVSLDGTLRIWQGDTLAPHHMFVVPTGDDALVVALSADGERLGYGWDASLQWFDLAKGTRDGVQTLPSPLVALVSVPGSSEFVVASEDGTVRGPGSFSLALDRKIVTAAVDPTGTRLAVSHNAEAGPHMEFGAVGIFDLETAERVVDVKTHRADEAPHPSAYLTPAHHLAFSADGKRLAAGGYSLQVWDATTGHLETDTGWEGNPFEGRVSEVSFDPGGESVTFVANLSVPVRMRLDDDRPVPRFGDDVVGRELAVSASRIILAASDGAVRSFDRKTDRPLAIVEGPPAGVVVLAFVPDGRTILAGLSDGALFELPLGGPAPTIHPAHGDEIDGLAIDPTTGTLLTGAHDGSLRAWRLDPIAPVATLSERGAPVFTLTYCGGSKLALAGRADGTVERIELDPPRIVDQWTAHTKEVTGVACSRDGTRIATVSEDGTGKLWSQEGKDLGTLAAPEGKRAYQAVVFAGADADSEALVTGEAFLGGDALRRWTVPATGDPRPQSIASLKYGVTRLAPLPGTDYIVGADLGNGGATIWNALDGSIVAQFPGVRGTTMALAVSADGQTIATGTTGNERAVRVWHHQP